MLADQYKTMELHRDNLLADLKRFAGETIDRVERQKNIAREFNPETFLANSKKEARALVFPNEIEKETKKVLEIKETVIVEEKVLVEAKIPSSPKSFFDDIQ